MLIISVSCSRPSEPFPVQSQVVGARELNVCHTLSQVRSAAEERVAEHEATFADKQVRGQG
jgi:hypothetical protein